MILDCRTAYSTVTRALDFVVNEVVHLCAGPEVVLRNPDVVIRMCSRTTGRYDVLDLVIGPACGNGARPSCIWGYWLMAVIQTKGSNVPD